jgi:asparagine synthase (glutamine-hydrolysing)
MCGISGVWHYHDGQGRPLETAAIVRVTNSLRHRGPDDEGYVLINTQTRRTVRCGGNDTIRALNLPAIEAFQDEVFDLALGFRRLSILDLSPAGHQPMSSADNKCWIVFNGEIYNYLELRSELGRYDYQFRTGTDTEVILAAYRHWGVDCLSHFDGMWSFAIWDETARHLFLARDRFGIKPFYYANDGERFVFASEIKALLQHAHIGRRVNPQRLYEYLILGLTDHGEETLFAGIYQLPAAHFLTLSIDRPQDARPQRYWQLDARRELKIPFDAAAEHLRELFRHSVELHLRGDVEPAAMLSGGIDSSSLVSCMRAMDRESKLTAFSYVADDPVLNEDPWIDIVGDAANLVVDKTLVTSEQLIAEMDDFVASQDEPFGSTSIYAQYCVLRAVHEGGFKFVLSGQGADEILAGYTLFVTTQFAFLLARGDMSGALRLLRGASTRPNIKKSALLYGAGRSLMPFRLGTYTKNLIGMETAFDPEWLNVAWFEKWGVNSSFPTATGRSLKDQLCDMITKSNLPMLLRHEDRLAMAHSVESRVPFLTASLVEFLMSLPATYLLSADGASKHVFRNAMRGIVPDSILNRQDKIGFDTPERRWLIDSRLWVDKVLSSDAAKRIPVLNLPAIREEWANILAGRQVYNYKVWRWLNLIRWADKLEIDF